MTLFKIEEGNSMSSVADNSPLEKMLQFHGRLLSGYSHELKNHLAIINESNGLLHDYIEMGRITDEDLSKKLTDILLRLDNRVDKMTEMAHHLNSFAHRFDSASSNFDLNDLIIEQVFFLQRSARLKRIELTTCMQKSGVSIYCNAALLQFILNHLVNNALDLLQENDQLDISTAQLNSNVQIILSLKSKSLLHLSPKSEFQVSELEFCIKQIGASLTVNSVKNISMQIFFSLPIDNN